MFFPFITIDICSSYAEYTRVLPFRGPSMFRNQTGRVGQRLFRVRPLSSIALVHASLSATLFSLSYRHESVIAPGTRRRRRRLQPAAGQTRYRSQAAHTHTHTIAIGPHRIPHNVRARPLYDTASNRSWCQAADISQTSPHRHIHIAVNHTRERETACHKTGSEVAIASAREREREKEKRRERLEIRRQLGRRWHVSISSSYINNKIKNSNIEK